MSLDACGTVVAQSSDRVIVRIEHEGCTNCTGNCVRFGIPSKIEALGSEPIGVRVLVTASSRNLLVASLIVLGFPIAIAVLAVVIWQSVVAVVGGLALSLLVVYSITRLKFFPKLLRAYAKSLD